MHDVLQRLGISSSLELVMLVNGTDASPDRRIVEADIIDVFPPLAGGVRNIEERHGFAGALPSK